jgi:hypothetical protein
MKRPNFRKITLRKHCDQGGRCFYCDQPMWIGDPVPFAVLYAIGVQRARQLQATAEHLLARSEGGSDNAENIVAACAFCNRTRHKTVRPLTPEAYRRRVQSRMVQGKWHGLRFQS